jgi:hypothetical protein
MMLLICFLVRDVYFPEQLAVVLSSTRMVSMDYRQLLSLMLEMVLGLARISQNQPSLVFLLEL